MENQPTPPPIDNDPQYDVELPDPNWSDAQLLIWARRVAARRGGNVSS